MPHPVAATMDALAYWLRQHADLTSFASNIWSTPPDNLPRLPAIVILWDNENASQFDGSGDVPMNRQYLDETLEVRVLSDQVDAQRSQTQLLTAVNAIRETVNSHQSLRTVENVATCMQARYEAAKYEPVEYGDQAEINGATVTVRALIEQVVQFAG